MGVIDLEIYVPPSAFSSFNTARVERSVGAIGGPYSELTKVPPADAATLLGTTASPFVLSGQTLELKVDSQATASITFLDPNPIHVDLVVTRINTVLGATIASEEVGTGKLRLTSTLVGTQSKLEIIGGSAAPTLGFTAGQRDIGSEPWIILIVGQEEYTFSDKDGEAGYYYRTWLYDTVTGLESARSAPFQGVPGTQISSDHLSLATIDIVDASGKAVQGQKISFFPHQEQNLEVEDWAVALCKTVVTIETDGAGHAEVSLVRGLSLRVVFEGTSLIRDIVVPNTPSFDILGAVGSALDIFDVHSPTLPTAPRRTL